MSSEHRYSKASVWIRWVLGAVIMIAVLALPLTGSAFWMSLATGILVLALAACSLNFVFGYGGMLDVGHAAYFAVGSYATVLFASSLPEWPVGVGLLVATGLATIAAFVIGGIVLRTEGFYLALATLAVGLIVEAIARTSVRLGRSAGLTASTRDIFGFGDITRGQLYIGTLVVVTLVVVAMSRFPQSRAGRALNLTKNSRTLADAVGIDTRLLRLQVFVLGGALAGLAGALSAVNIRFMSPTSAGVTESVRLLVVTVIGGLGRAVGPVLGALVIRGLPEAFQQFEDLQTILMGTTFLVVLLRFRGGLVGMLDSLVRKDASAVKWQGGQPPAPVSSPVPRASQLPRVDPEAGDAPALLEVRELRKNFAGLEAVRDVSFSVRAGELHALVGPNGSGKTTIVNLCTGFLTPTAGDVLWKGDSVLGASPHELARLGMLRTFQLIELSHELTVLENVMVGTHLQTSSGLLRGFVPKLVEHEERRVREAAVSVIEQLGLQDYAYQYPDSVPAGIRRLAEVGRCIVAGADLLILDEPAAGLNEEAVAELAILLRGLSAAGTAILLIEHDMSLVMEVSDVVSVLDAGGLIAAGTPEDVSRDPAVVEAYIGKARSERLIGKAST